MKVRRILTITLAALGTLAEACAHQPESPPPPSSPSALVGRPMPVARGRLADGAVFSEDAATQTMRGKVVVVKFFAEYCRPCLRTLPEAVRLSKQHPGALFVGVAQDEDPAAVQRQIARFRLPFPVVVDSSHAVAGRFRVTELPATFVADRAGTVVWVGGPEQPDDALERVIRALQTGR